jgi:hypothetical protein
MPARTPRSPDLIEGSVVEGANKLVDAFSKAHPRTEGWGVPIGDDYSRGIRIDPRMNELRVTILDAGKLLVAVVRGQTYREYFDTLEDGRGCAQHEKLAPYELDEGGNKFQVRPEQYAAALFDPKSVRMRGLLRITADTARDEHYGRVLLPFDMHALDISPQQGNVSNTDFTELADGLAAASPLPRAEIASSPLTPAMAFFFRDTDL